MTNDPDSNTALLFEGKMKRETDKAVLFQFSFSDEKDGVEHWIPFSQVSMLKISHSPHGKDMLKIPKWLAKNRNLIDEEES